MTEVAQIEEKPELIALLESETLGQFLPAFINAQGEFTPARRDATNTHFSTTYATLTGAMAAVKPALLKYRITPVQQTFTDREGFGVLFTRLIHESNEWLGSQWRLKPVKADPQGEGSALTYARRQALMTLCGIAPEDDDGNAGSVRGEQSQQRREPAPEVPAPSGRDWVKEADVIIDNVDHSASKRADNLLALFNECQGFHEMTPALQRKITQAGKKLRTEANAAVEPNTTPTPEEIAAAGE